MTHPDPDPRTDQPQPRSAPVLEPYGPPTPTAVQPQVGPAFEPYGQSAHATPPAGLPLAGLPPAGQPYGPDAATAGRPPTAPPRKRTAVVVLSVLAVLFLATAGVFGVLYANETSRNNQLTSQLSDKERELTDSGEQLERAKEDASKAKNAQEIAEDARKRAENDGASMVKCRDAARALREAALANNEAKGEEAFLQLFSVC